RLEERVIFLLDLEAIVAELHPSMAINFEGLGEQPPTAKAHDILHVDDSRSIRSLVLQLLTKEGHFNVEQRVNGQEAWDYLLELRHRSESENRPISDYVQGIITDIEMPSMDGLALCKRIKDDPVLKVLPVAIFSSMINESLSRKCATVGSDAQFTKPDLTGLSLKMEELIKKCWGE
ncbi:MAG: response regulator, partial [Desulfovibrionaceae bacterium]|nr:response regulator [Desulfovibrionaceae bacterium]